MIAPNLQRIDRSDEKAEFLPTPQEIADGCQRIQSRWTPEERRRRIQCHDPNRRVTAPTISVADLDVAFGRDQF